MIIIQTLIQGMLVQAMTKKNIHGTPAPSESKLWLSCFDNKHTIASRKFVLKSHIWNVHNSRQFFVENPE